MLHQAVVSVAWLLRPAPEGEGVFEDPDTGAVFQTPPGKVPERDRRGELAFRAVSFTPFPVEADEAGERVRINVGPVGACQPRTFVFDKLLEASADPPTASARTPAAASRSGGAVTVADLAPPVATSAAPARRRSQLVTVTLERPLGLIIEEDARTKRAAVADIVDGSRAAQRAQLAGFDRARRADAALRGDVVRAFTATNLVYPAKSLLFGMQPPQRQVVVFGADGQKWERVSAALKQGLKEDGPVTLVLERVVEEPGSR
eukprot:jgi/Ulvmu1/8713/UM047_0053.1